MLIKLPEPFLTLETCGLGNFTTDYTSFQRVPPNSYSAQHFEFSHQLGIGQLLVYVNHLSEFPQIRGYMIVSPLTPRDLMLSARECHYQEKPTLNDQELLKHYFDSGRFATIVQEQKNNLPDLKKIDLEELALKFKLGLQEFSQAQKLIAQNDYLVNPTFPDIHCLPFAGILVALEEQSALIVPHTLSRHYQSPILPNPHSLIKFGDLSSTDLKILEELL